MQTVKIKCNDCGEEKEDFEFYWEKTKTGQNSCKLKYKFCRACFKKRQDAKREMKRREHLYY